MEIIFSSFFSFIPGGTEWVVILLVFLLLFGSSKIPEFARGLGKALREFQKAKSEFDHEIKAITEQTREEIETARQELIRTPAEIISSEGKLLEGTFTGDGRIRSPHSDFTIEPGERQPGDRIFDANTGKAFLIPDPLNVAEDHGPTEDKDKAAQA
ncbi:twin-arginine translocase TatA/TatE family subunit [Kamptonema cortianum]|uniref:Sec-independent protein translocase protein TatA n=1 Tax=Geitlerinema calcuttense NRMC-F 0142 TaxID=2922238 RepID=A0ABT7M0X1_9CYAN|nr:twin-arginine translocase TatA/TatE family subunit [Geitlerinema calcuttense]MDK3161809.1 twin-arginine translocase TatA/TatE family subunit [Kamptonema cortianum]MDL5054380.1 twin-arginine translocase TatA/TatE family subunit [Oscillatoria laete-virens NRMC-F 0139]MDL5057896.1 twin-arginine translocase TatA/TatE family subunit [Geitlerinema calcuttense NRMC-F 0142]